jgi:hypothetical protein
VTLRVGVEASRAGKLQPATPAASIKNNTAQHRGWIKNLFIGNDFLY